MPEVANNLAEIPIGTTSWLGCSVPIMADLTASSWETEINFDVDFEIRTTFVEPSTAPSLLDAFRHANLSDMQSSVDLDIPMLGENTDSAPENDRGHILCGLNPIRGVSVLPPERLQVDIQGAINLDMTVSTTNTTAETALPENIVIMESSTRIEGSLRVSMDNDSYDQESGPAPLVIDVTVNLSHSDTTAIAINNTPDINTEAIALDTPMEDAIAEPEIIDWEDVVAALYAPEKLKELEGTALDDFSKAHNADPSVMKKVYSPEPDSREYEQFSASADSDQQEETVQASSQNALALS